jgi:hypothetical protein
MAQITKKKDYHNENQACGRAVRLGYAGKCTECPFDKGEDGCLDTMSKGEYSLLLNQERCKAIKYDFYDNVPMYEIKHKYHVKHEGIMNAIKSLS